MTPKVALEKREQMIREGYCVIENILTEEFLQELHDAEKYELLEEDYPFMFDDHPNQVDVCVNAGSLILTDARLLHAARKNTTEKRRTLLLAWHQRPNTVPDYWEGEIPEPIAGRDPKAEYPQQNVPGKFLYR